MSGNDAANVATTTTTTAWGWNFLFYIPQPGAVIHYWKFQGKVPDVSGNKLQINQKDVAAPKGYARAITVDAGGGNQGIRLFLLGKKDEPDQLVEYCLDDAKGDWFEGSLSKDNHFIAAPDSILCPVVNPLSIFYQSKSVQDTGLSVLDYQGASEWISRDTKIVFPKT